MPNNLVFNPQPDQLKVQIFGSETGSALSTTGGKLNIASISDTVSITVGDLDIRNLAYTQDTVRVYGSETYALSTTEGKLNIASISDAVTVTATDLDIRNLTSASDSVQIGSRYFSETSATDVTGTSSTFTGLLAQNVSTYARNVSFAVHNKGANGVNIRVDVSPDNSLWITDTSAVSLAGNAATVFVPKYFLKYARIAYASYTDGSAFTLDAWFQAQV